MSTSVTVKGYRVFYDGATRGHNDAWCGTGFLQDGLLTFVYPHGVAEEFIDDDQGGAHSYSVTTRDLGKTWGAPEPFGPSLVKDPPRESLLLGVSGPTRRGTVLAAGFHQVLGPKATRIHDDPAIRPYTLVLGRKTRGSRAFDYRTYPSGTFLGEQFMERGIELPSGRLVYALWGVKERGENWRCGVLLSDDDGVSWRYRDVGYEADRGIRKDPASEVPAGYNEQTLFRTREGELVSIIRGRENLGRVEGSPRDTWFFRSESTDEGESWSRPQATNLAGTGATGVGLTLPDGSLLTACRVPYSRTLLDLPEPELYGLHLARSFDAGRTWATERLVQRAPDDRPFTNHYNAMNGQFIPLSAEEFLYVFGHFAVGEKRHRVLALELGVD